MESVTDIDRNFTHTNVSVNATDIIVFSSAMYFSIGSLMTIIMVFGFTTNMVILYTYATNRKIRTVDDTLIIGLALGDIGQSILDIPFVAISSFSQRWVFGHAICQYHAFANTAFGISQISMLTVIAMERYFVIVRHDRRLTNAIFKCVIIILCSFIYGSLWAVGPLFGWSGYKEEGIRIACSVKWGLKDGASFSYTISLFTFGWFIPLFLIAFGYISITYSLYSERNNTLQSRRHVTECTRNQIHKEWEIALTVLIIIGAFIVSWTPYKAVSLWSAVDDLHTIPLWAQVAPGVFAKCSIIWNPLIYVARHKNIRQSVKQSLSSLKFWNRDDLQVRNVEIKTSDNRGGHIYNKTETHNKKNRLCESFKCDNYGTHVDGPGGSETSPSIILKITTTKIPQGKPRTKNAPLQSPVSFRRPRLIRQNMFNSTLDSSINGHSVTYKSNAILNSCVSKMTQTEDALFQFPCILQKDFSDRCAQTTVSGSIRGDGESAPHTFVDCTYIHHQTKRDDLGKPDKGHQSLEEIEHPIEVNISEKRTSPKVNHTVNLSSHNSMPKQQKAHLKETATSLTSIENRNELLEKNIKIGNPRNLDALKERREILRKRLNAIVRDNEPVDILPKLSESRQVTKIRELPGMLINKDANDLDLQKQIVTYISPRSKSAKQDTQCRPVTNIIQGRFMSPLSRRSTTSSSHLHVQPYYAQKLERYKEKTYRERIISDPTTVEMQTFRFNPDARAEIINHESNIKYDSARPFKPSADKSPVFRQSTV